MNSVRSAGVFGLALIAALTVSGCTASARGPSYSDLERDRVPQDELPALGEQFYEPIDPSTARYAGRHDGIDVWLARASGDSPQACLVIVGGPGREMIGCGGGTATLSGTEHRFTIVIDGHEPPEGATPLSENVYTHP